MIPDCHQNALTMQKNAKAKPEMLFQAVALAALGMKKDGLAIIVGAGRAVDRLLEHDTSIGGCMGVCLNKSALEIFAIIVQSQFIFFILSKQRKY